MSTLSDVLPPVNPAQDALAAPQPKQGALDRLKRRMENYREMQSNRLPQYDQTMSQINVQQMQETKVLRQKFLESKAKKPNKKSSSSSSSNSSAEKIKQEMNAMSNMNGMMGYHGGNLPPGHPGLQPGGPHMNHAAANHGGSQQMLHHPPSVPQKRPLEEDTKNTPDTAKRLNLENGNSSDGSHNSVKREPSPLESKFQPGGNNFPSKTVHTSATSNNNSGKHSADASLSDLKPVIKTEDTSADFKPPTSDQEEADTKIKSEVDNLKQEDTLGDLDLKDFDGFDGMNTDTFQDLMDDLPEFDKNFYETLDFGDGKNGVDDGDDEKLMAEAEAQLQQCHTSALPEGSQANTVSRPGGTSTATSSSSTAGQPNAAEALKMMAQVHQQPNMGMDGPPQQPPSSMAGGGGPSFPPSGDGGPGPGGQMYGDRNYPIPTSAMMDSRASDMNTTMAPTLPGGPAGMMMRPRMGEADPRFRPAVNPRYRLGNPTSIAGAQMPPGSSSGGPMTEQQRMEMMRSNPNMMNMQNPSMSPNMSMMGQQVGYYTIFKFYI